MAFSNPIIGSGDTLVRQAIQSENYVAGVSGWRITRDGDAEFNNVTVRGELFVQDADGSYVRIFDEDPGAGAVILVHPADTPADVTAAQIRGDWQNFGLGGDRPFLLLESPEYNGHGTTALKMYGTSGDGASHSRALLDSSEVYITGDDIVQLQSGTTIVTMTPADGLQVTGDETVLGDLTYDGAAWTTFTPSWTGSTTNPSLGNGTVSAAYRLDGKTCFFRMHYTYGTTTNFGSGAWAWSVPIPVLEFGTASMFCQDQSATLRYPAVGYVTNSNVGRGATYSPSGGNAGLSSSNPFTWASADQLIIGGHYEADV